jgi:hypothetical protein
VGAATRIDRFRNHAEGTLNWSSVHTFARMALDPTMSPTQALGDYVRADYPGARSDAVAAFAGDLYTIGASLFYLRRYWFCSHSNPPDFPKSFRRDNHRGPLAWTPEDPRAIEDANAMESPRPEHIEALITEQRTLAGKRDEWTRYWQTASDTDMALGDLVYLRAVCKRLTLYSDIVWRQQQLVLMVRHDAAAPAGGKRYAREIEEGCRFLESIASMRRSELRVIGAEGNQHVPEILESFCIEARKARF